MAIGLEPDENLVLAMKKKKNERFPSISGLFQHVCTTATRSDMFAQQRWKSLQSAVERSSIQRATLKIAVLCKTIGIGIQTKSAEGAKLIHILRQFSRNISLT